MNKTYQRDVRQIRSGIEMQKVSETRVRHIVLLIHHDIQNDQTNLHRNHGGVASIDTVVTNGS